MTANPDCWSGAPRCKGLKMLFVEDPEAQRLMFERGNLSKGIAVFEPGVDENTQAVLARADAKMYEEKRAYKEKRSCEEKK